MLVLNKQKTLLTKLNNPERILATVPSSRRISVRGNDLVAIPHKLDECKVLRNMGVNAPSPILHYYDWPGRFTPFAHQKETAAFLTLHQKCLVLNEIGTGKTQSALWAADYLIREGVIRKVLILSPLSTLERVWGDAIFTGFPAYEQVTLYGAAARRRKLLNTDVDFYIINHDGFKVVSSEMYDMFDLVIVDEAAVYRNNSSQRFKHLNKWLSKQSDIRVWLMTGTPTPNAPTDAWALAKLVDNSVVASTFTAFRDQTMYKIQAHTWIPRHNSVDTVRHVLQPSVRYTRDECFDLPETIVQDRKVDLTAEQTMHYKTMLSKMVTQADNGEEITAINEAVKIQKLVQIACGVAYSETGANVELDCKPRVNATAEIIEEAGSKVIVFVPLTGTLKMLERELSKKFTVAVVNGATPASKRNEIFHSFQNEDDPMVLIAHPATMAHGLTLTSASTIIWYGPVTSNEQYTQANGRIERIGKRHTSNVVHIAGTELEHRMYKRLASKQKLQGVLLDIIAQGTKG